MDGVSKHPVTTKIQASFLTQLPERTETAQGFNNEANGDIKQLEFNRCDRRLRMDQQSVMFRANIPLELLTKTTLNVPERPIYNFDLNWLDNLWQDLKMSV